MLEWWLVDGIDGVDGKRNEHDEDWNLEVYVDVLCIYHGMYVGEKFPSCCHLFSFPFSRFINIQALKVDIVHYSLELQASFGRDPIFKIRNSKFKNLSNVNGNDERW